MIKRFTLIVTEEDGNLTFDGDNNGFNGLELAGLFTLKLGDIVDQINNSSKFTRVAKTEDSTVEIVEKEETPAKIGFWYVEKDPRMLETKLTCSMCGHAAKSYGPIALYPEKCPSCGSFMNDKIREV